MKTIVAIAAAGIAAVVLASPKLLASAEGRGVLIGEGDHRATFKVAARKSSHGQQTSTNGTVELRTGTTTNGRRIRGTVHMLNVIENVAHMSGPAVMVIWEGGVAHEFAGRFEASATSRRHPGETGDPDSMVLHFVREGGPNFSFGGRVHEGDITVGKSVNY